MDFMVRQVPWVDKHELARNLETLREAVRAIEIVRNRMPAYGQPIEVSQEERERIRAQISALDTEERNRLAERVSAASTLSEQERVLQAAGIRSLERHKTRRR